MKFQITLVAHFQSLTNQTVFDRDKNDFPHPVFVPKRENVIIQPAYVPEGSPSKISFVDFDYSPDASGGGSVIVSYNQD